MAEEWTLLVLRERLSLLCIFS